MPHQWNPDDSGLSCLDCPLPEKHPGHAVAPAPGTPGSRDGATFSPVEDSARLNAQAQRVYEAMSTGEWLTLADLAEYTGDPEASCSARLRDFRKPQFGGYEVERQRVPGGTGLWRYRLLIPTGSRP